MDEIGPDAVQPSGDTEELRRRQEFHAVFGSYLDPAVVDRIVREGGLVQGVEVLVTLLVLDIRDFTPFADRSSARETVAYLNDFFGRVVPIIRKHHGHPNRFLGDGLLAVFGVPEELDDHAERAVAAAVEISATLKESHRIGIGINSGVVVAGTIGGGGRLDFTLIGDAVNVAGRIEQLTKETGDTMLVGESTRVLLGHHPTFVFEWRGTHTVRGKSEQVDVYALARFPERRDASVDHADAEQALESGDGAR